MMHSMDLFHNELDTSGWSVMLLEIADIFSRALKAASEGELCSDDTKPLIETTMSVSDTE